jgi:hypothetical protein
MAKKRKRKDERNQKRDPPRRIVQVHFPRDLYAGIEAIAAMEHWSDSKTVVEIVRTMIRERKPKR